MLPFVTILQFNNNSSRSKEKLHWGVGLVLGNLPATKHLTVITGSVTVGCRSVRYYCKTYGTFWSCTAAAGHGIKEAIKFTIQK